MAVSATPLLPTTGFAIRDANAHTYQTDPTSVAIIPLGDHWPPLRAWGVWIYNATAVSLTVQVIGNKVNNGYPTISATTIPDFNVGSLQTVGAGATAFIVGEFSQLPLDFISVSLQFASAPPAGTVFGELHYYH